MIDFINSSLSFQLFAILGSLIALVGSLITAIGYRGKEGEPYSPLNHYISELGEKGVSKFAWIFNLSMNLAGLCLIVACISLGLILPGILSKIALVFGCIYSIFLCMVGFIPMNKEEAHVFVAMNHFRSGLVMVALFSLAIGFQHESMPPISPWFALAGLPAIFSFATFLIIAPRLTDENDPLSNEDIDRPKVWPLVIVEWLIFLTIVMWFILIAWGLL